MVKKNKFPTNMVLVLGTFKRVSYQPGSHIFGQYKADKYLLVLKMV
jgi:hypothetical protein